jgi:hypothetical protein
MISVQTASTPSAAPLTHNQGFFRNCALPIALRRTLSAHQQTAHSKDTSSVFRDFSEVYLGESHADLSPNVYIRIKPRLWARETARARLSTASFTPLSSSGNLRALFCNIRRGVTHLRRNIRRHIPGRTTRGVAGSARAAPGNGRMVRRPLRWGNRKLALLVLAHG